MKDIPFGLVRKCDENDHEAWKDLIEKYEVSDERQESLNGVTNRYKNFSIKDTSQDHDIWFNEIFNLNPKLKKIKKKYEKYEDEMKALVCHVLPEDYKPARVSCNANIPKMSFKDLKKEIHWFWKTELNWNKKQEKPDQEEKVLALNSGEDKQYKNDNLYKGM